MGLNVVSIFGGNWGLNSQRPFTLPILLRLLSCHQLFPSPSLQPLPFPLPTFNRPHSLKWSDQHFWVKTFFRSSERRSTFYVSVDLSYFCPWKNTITEKVSIRKSVNWWFSWVLRFRLIIRFVVIFGWDQFDQRDSFKLEPSAPLIFFYFYFLNVSNNFEIIYFYLILCG